MSGERSMPLRRDTNSNNPNAIKARVFIGNLNNDKCTQNDLSEAFQRFGKITGCSVHKNFGFVQFDNEASARAMVAQWNGEIFAGKRIDCNIADERRKPQQKDSGPMRDLPRGRSPPPPPPRNRGPSPRRRTRSRSPRSRSSRERAPAESFRRREDRPSRFSGGDEDSYGAYNARYPSSSRPRDTSFERSSDSYERDSFSRRDYSYDSGYTQSNQTGGYGSYSEPTTTGGRGSDCEIVVLSKDQRGYGEMVEERLRRIGVNSKLVFPPPDVRVVDVIERIAKNGSLYSVVLSAQNELHRSCTLNIMHGTRQEHRNMPLEDALAFVAKNFEQYLRDREGSHSSSYPVHDYKTSMPVSNNGSSAASSAPDPNIAELLVAAAAGKALDDSQIAKLANELKKRNAAKEHGSSASSGQVSNHETQQANLQSLVLKTLGNPEDGPGKASDLRGEISGASYGGPTSQSYSGSPSTNSSSKTPKQGCSNWSYSGY